MTHTNAKLEKLRLVNIVRADIKLPMCTTSTMFYNIPACGIGMVNIRRDCHILLNLKIATSKEVPSEKGTT